MENQHRHIPGYRDLSEQGVTQIADIKGMEDKVVDFWRQVKTACPDLDPRDYALARTHFEDGFIRLVRSVAKPDTPWTREG